MLSFLRVPHALFKIQLPSFDIDLPQKFPDAQKCSRRHDGADAVISQLNYCARRTTAWGDENPTVLSKLQADCSNHSATVSLKCI